MSRAVICLLLLFMAVIATEVSNDTDLDSKDDNLQVMQEFEETARRQWELSSRKKLTKEEEELEQLNPSSSETVELFTWLPWYEKNRPAIHTLKALATFKKENASKLSQILGVGSWQEITLFDRKKANSIEEPDASALCRGSASRITSTFIWFITITFSLYLSAT